MILAAHLLLFGIGSTTYNFHRTYTVGAADVYALAYTDSNHLNNPLYGKLTLTVLSTIANSGGALVGEVVSEGRGHPPARNQNPNDPSVNLSTEVQLNSSGFPIWSGNAVPSKTIVDLMNLGMTAFRSGLNMGQTTPFSVATTGGATQATFAGQVTLTAVTPSPQIHVVGDMARGAGGASMTHFDGTFTIDAPSSRVTQLLLTANVGTRAFTAKINLTPQ